jgi:hypothetical protein
MHDAARRYQIVLGALIGIVFGFVLVSLVFSAYLASRQTLTWSDLSSIAGFWNGHLSLFTLIVIAMGLYLQARQFDVQLRTEQQERLKLRRDHAQTLFQILDSRLAQIGESVQGYEVIRDDTGKVKSHLLRGIWEIVTALRRLKASRAEDCEVWADERSLTSYLLTAKELATVSVALNELGSQIGDSQSSMPMSPASGITGEEEVEKFLDDLRSQRDEMLRRIRDAGCPTEILGALGSIGQLGWRLSIHQARDQWYVAARCFASDRSDEFQITSAASPDLASASKDLAAQWNSQFVV